MRFSQFLDYFRDALRSFSKTQINFSQHSVAYSIGAATASIAAKIMALLNGIEKRTSILFATGIDLDTLLSNFKIVRKTQSFSKGSLSIWRNSLPTTANFIPSGTSFTDVAGNSFITTEPCIVPKSTSHYPTDILGIINPRFYAVPLASGFTIYSDTDMSVEEIRQQLRPTIKIATQSGLAGIEFNVAENVITTSLTGSLFVNNPEPFYGGADIEDDESFRNRGLDLIRGSNSKFTVNSLTAFLKSQPGVADATIIEDYGCLSFPPPKSGHVYAIVSTTIHPNDTISFSEVWTPDPRNIYDDIRNAIENEGYRPAGAGITVKEAEIYNIDFVSDSSGLKVYVTDDVVPSIKKVEFREKIYDFFLQLKIGEDVYASDIVKLLKEDESVIDVASFEFKKISGVTDDGSDIYEEVATLDALANQVFRARSPQKITIEVVYQ